MLSHNFPSSRDKSLIVFDSVIDDRRKVVEACRNFKKLYKEARDRAFKALGFAKMLRNDLEIAALFRVHGTPAEVFLALQKSDHVQVKNTVTC